MREIDGVNELHKPNTEYNREVVDAITAATKANETNDFIDILAQAKTLRDVERANQKKEVEIKGKNENIVEEIKQIIKKKDGEEGER